MRPGSLLRPSRRRACTLSYGRVSARRHLTQLQRANVGDDLPAIFDRNLRCVARHRAPTVGHHVKEMAYRRLSQLVLMERCGPGFVESTSCDHAVAITRHAMTGRTKDLITLLPAFKYFFRD